MSLEKNLPKPSEMKTVGLQYHLWLGNSILMKSKRSPYYCLYKNVEIGEETEDCIVIYSKEFVSKSQSMKPWINSKFSVKLIKKDLRRFDIYTF